MYTTAAVMLTLAAISYRGYDLLHPLYSGAFSQARLRSVMLDCLDTLAPVKDQWDIVWGPSGFSSAIGGFDELVMYVAQNRQKPTQFVVAIRGTNPISLTDWIACDLSVNETVPWPYAYLSPDAGARVSCSTAFDLSVLQNLHPILPGGSAAFTAELGAWLGRVNVSVSKWFGGISSPATATVGSLDDLLEEFECKRKEIAVHPALQRRARECERLLPERFDPLTIVDEKNPHSASLPGINIRDFFSQAIRKAKERIDIYVTGHSKGGALSSTFALWLCDTQGAAPVPIEHRWDPEHVATVYSYSFAAPTAGNGEFARHSDSVMRDRCWRIYNNQDIVPHVWSVDDLKLIPSIYGPIEEQALLTKGCDDASVQWDTLTINK